MELSVIVPAYNEEARIAPTLKTIAAVLRGTTEEFEIIVVDDGSTDGTARLVNQLSREIPELRWLGGESNRGKGYAVRRGMLAAHGRVRVMCDADGSTPATEIDRLLAPIYGGQADVVIGSRYGRGREEDQPRWRYLWSRLVNEVIQETLLPGIDDTQCGFKAFSAEAALAVFAQARIDGWAFDLEALTLAHRCGYLIKEVRVEWVNDERSRVEPLRDLVAVAREWHRLQRNLRAGVYRFAKVEAVHV